MDGSLLGEGRGGEIKGEEACTRSLGWLVDRSKNPGKEGRKEAVQKATNKQARNIEIEQETDVVVQPCRKASQQAGSHTAIHCCMIGSPE
mmetsp:Transcript_21905/g.43480  ORF Transcript_21905/g.43480 Transcript_21905/m.43480 type:complete len:90 (-) Transcript_21905:64-333(-)